MNHIKKILYKYLSPEYIEIIGIEEKTDDVWWMIEHGYQNDFTILPNGMWISGELTKDGEKYIKKCNKRIQELAEKVKNITTSNEHKAGKEIIDYMKNNSNGDIYKGLTDDEKRTCHRLTRYFL